MHPATEYIDPRAKLVDEVAAWLCGRAPSAGRRGYAGRVRADPSGAESLAHVMVVVPTAQSGRNLRLALARSRRFAGRGLVPPRVVQPMQLVVPADESLPEATDAEVAAAFLAFAERRPRRRVEDGGIAAIEEWTHLFRPEAMGDHDALFSFLDQLSDIWRTLGAGGLLMGDVPGNEAARRILGDAMGDEADRWDELAELESAFFAFLHGKGLRHPAESLRLARTAPKAIPEEIEEVVLPALVDSVPVLCDVLARQTPRTTVLLHCDEADRGRFDEWGRPKVECWTGSARPVLERLRDEDIFCAASDSALADLIAADFPDAGANKDVPALGLCDEELYAPLSAALGRKGWDIHNPTKFRLRSSSLGRIAERLVSLRDRGDAPYPWDDFVALLREDDVLRRLARRDDEEGTRKKRAAILRGLDVFRNRLFPSEVPQDGKLAADRIDGADDRGREDRSFADQFAVAAGQLAHILRRARKGTSGIAPFLREALAEIYEGRELGDGIGDREFSAAIDALLSVLEQLDGATIASLAQDPSLQTALFRKCLSDAAYSLEPDSAKALVTEGWLELAWSDKDRIVLAGFREGAVPEDVAGHVFLPDRLRSALGLPSNARRLARDTFLLREMLGSREPGDVHACFARTNMDGDIHRPSRLLFLVGDKGLPGRVDALFGPLPPQSLRGGRAIAPGWAPRLSSEIPLLPGEKDGGVPRLSASRLDAWLACPFAYYLKHVLRMERVEEKEELAANDFGTFVHDVLEEFARAQIERDRKGLPQLRDEKGIADALREIAAGFRARFGAAPSLKFRLQLEAAEKRLANVAKVQAAWAEGGWRIVAAELPFDVRPFEGEGSADVAFSGRIDRVDWKEGVGYRLIDYKTWDARSKAAGHVLKGGEEEIAHATRLGLPVTDECTAPKKGAPPEPRPRRFRSVQLPLYGLCFEKWLASDAGAELRGRFGTAVGDYCYLVIGTDPGNTAVFGSRDDKFAFAARTKPKTVLADLADRARKTARVAIRRIRAGIFWPPGPEDALRYDLKDAFLDSARRDLKDSEWVAEQERRISASVPARTAPGENAEEDAR